MPRFSYSKWDGTQVGFNFDAEDIFEELTDELSFLVAETSAKTAATSIT